MRRSFCPFAGRAVVGTTRRGTLLRSCPPSACGLLLLILRCEESPEPPGLSMACRRTTFADGKSSSLFEVLSASTGHRGRVDARGRHFHIPAGLTRTSGLGADAPSRVRRTRRLRRRGLGVTLRGDEVRAIGAGRLQLFAQAANGPFADASLPTNSEGRAFCIRLATRSVAYLRASSRRRSRRGCRSREGALAYWPAVRVKPAGA